MSPRRLTLTFRGVRGSIPVPGASTVRYGGNTTCVEVMLAEDHRLILDCGSGLRTLSDVVPTGRPCTFDVFLTHYHDDHILGLPLFAPLHDPDARFTFHGPSCAGLDVRQALEASMAPPWFPIRLRDTRSAKRFFALDDAPIAIADLTVTNAAVNHPQGARAYRLDRGSRAIALVTDHEPGDERVDARLSEFIEGVDVLIHDAQYTADEYDARYRGWGHSSWRHAVETAQRARAGKLLLFHHDPGRSDDEVDRIVERARGLRSEVAAAAEGMTLSL